VSAVVVVCRQPLSPLSSNSPIRRHHAPEVRDASAPDLDQSSFAGRFMGLCRAWQRGVASDGVNWWVASAGHFFVVEPPWLALSVSISGRRETRHAYGTCFAPA